jgi:hypothetical protein
VGRSAATPFNSGMFSKLAHPVEQGSANIFCKGQNRKYFRLCGPRGKLEDIYVGRPT